MNNDQNNIEHAQGPYFYIVIFFEKPYGLFTYQHHSPIQLYAFVQVPFGRTVREGCVWAISSNLKTEYEIKSILAVIAPPCWDSAAVEFLEFSSKYYKVPLQEVLQTALPSSLRKSWFAHSASASNVIFEDLNNKPALSSLDLLPQQAQIVEYVKKSGFDKVLIFGVTGSGKTRCYVEAMRYWLQHGNILYMIPEIHLSHQVVMQIHEALGCEVFVYHSQVSPKKRQEVFFKARFSKKGCVFITTRSGIFLPFHSLKMVVIDEEHDPSYKQQEGLFRYHARDLALFRAKQFDCMCLMGSATPSPKFLFGVARPTIFELASRATGHMLPAIEVHSCATPTIEMPIDNVVLKMMRDVLQKGEQVLVYLNQRGYAPRLYCHPCREFATCPQCMAALVYHYEDGVAMCHHCAWTVPFETIEKCPQCGDARSPIGFGTERLSIYLEEVFPKTPQYRFDSDVVKTPKQVKALLDKIQSKGPAIIIGTQMISKGHDWACVTLAILLVGAFQLKEQLTPFLVQQLLQTAGRAGRHAPGRVIMPISHMQIGQEGLLRALDQGQYTAFTEGYLKEHPEQALSSAKIFFQSQNLEVLLRDLRILAHRSQADGPFMDFPVKRGKLWRAFIQILRETRTSRSHALDQVLSYVGAHPVLKKSFLSIEVDPLSLY